MINLVRLCWGNGVRVGMTGHTHAIVLIRKTELLNISIGSKDMPMAVQGVFAFQKAGFVSAYTGITPVINPHSR